jgi:nucleotide-binding universal stress UspA family protein
MRGTIVCDVTEPLAGRSAAEFASAIGSRVGLRLVLVHVVPGPAPHVAEPGAASRARGAAGEALEAIARELGHGAETRVAAGDHVEALARVASEEGADVIVIGARPAGLGGRNLRGTLARQLEAATSVPVLVAPPSTRKRSDRRLAVAAEGE